MIDVACAVIRNEENEILVVQRGEKTDHPFKWEFPGGKLNKGETEEECVIREIREELSMDIVICNTLTEVVHDYGHKKIRLIPFVCDTLDDMPFLAEHVAFKWVDAKNLPEVDFSEADIFVAEEYLFSLKKRVSDEPAGVPVPEESVDEEQLMAMISTMMGTKEAEWMALSAVDNPVLFRKLLDFSWSGDKKLAFRASWILTKACEKQPGIEYPYLPGIIENLDKTDNESALRSFMRIISFSDPSRLTSRHHGILAELCFKSLNSGVSSIAVKAYSMDILFRLTTIYPELASELAASIMNMMDEGSAGIVSRGRMILKKLSQ